ncbi:hypothetical protein M8J76_014987 [Diaphorina citri]|nr:hypothetical protein M8J76_014987 [Diaphorina citri]
MYRFSCVSELNCCTKSSGSCRKACEQLPLVTLALNSTLREQRISELKNYCPAQLMSFWKCLNETVQEINKGESWSGRTCCHMTLSERCQYSCITATSKTGDECCGNARTVECHRVCRAIFQSELTPSKEMRTGVVNACSSSSPKVMHCVKNFTKVAPVVNNHKHLHCCDKAPNLECKESCHKSLRAKLTDQEIIDNLQEGGCGPPLPHEKLWQCFLQGASEVSSSPVDREVSLSRIDRMGMDSAKLHCCYKAVSPACRRLCLKTFSNEWTKSWEDFDKDCLSQLSETVLENCLNEVEEPCELGCDGLGYCSNFNNRPTELFRSCTSQADDAARYDVALWAQQGTLSLPGLQLPVRNISRCSPETWKTIACILQIKPCHKRSHSNSICRDDCYELLSECLDWYRMPPGHSAASLCSRFSPDDPNAPCISLKSFMEPSDSPYQAPADQVTSPCRGDPCPVSHICSVNRNCHPRHHRTTCQPYQCTQGCKLGEVSQYLVPAGSYVRIPLTNGQKGCLKICQCSSHGVIEKCQPLPCFPLDSCVLGGKKIEHGTLFLMECNTCSCYAGEIVCTKKQCRNPTQTREIAFTSLPCNCVPHHVPVCGRNGVTYPNSCLAKCAGLSDSDFEFGPCTSKNPCDSHPCSEGEVCLPSRQVCLSLLHKPCEQYTCVSARDSCSSHAYMPVCDTEGVQYNNLCYLVRYGKTLAYEGPCLVGCDRTGLVCGVDGNTYASECAAMAASVAVDYRGNCAALGYIGNSAEIQCRSDAIQCPPLVSPHCLGVTPPGACCPICAGALRVLYSQKQVDRALYALRGSAMSALSVHAVLKALERQVQVAQCAIRGHLTLELDLLILLVPTSSEPSQVQLEACVREAEKLATLITNSSPRIVSELSLSPLIAAHVVHTEVVSSAGRVSIGVASIVIALAMCLLR